MGFFSKRNDKIMKPLADKIRPNNIEDVVGQEHLLGENKILHKIIKNGYVTNMIFYGPPGVGKTTVANIIADKTNKKLYKLNATNASVDDIKKIINNLDNLTTINGVLLYLDEIQNFNKKQQQSLLEFIENGKITLIASTTENPYHYIYKAILSRSSVFEFKMLSIDDIKKSLKRAINLCSAQLGNANIQIDKDVIDYIANKSNGDLRQGINKMELLIYSSNPNEDGDIIIKKENIEDILQEKISNYDKFGDSHYDILSAFQKSIRGSDVDASLHYLARLIKAQDLISICRRLLVIASEDIGMAYPNAVVIVKSCIDSANMLGFPEARIPLAQAVITLATSPKSNSAICAIDKAVNDIENEDVGDIPIHLKDAHYSGAKSLGRGVNYKYPHDYENNYTKQEYLPKNIKNSRYYIAGNNKMEQKMRIYMENLKQ